MNERGEWTPEEFEHAFKTFGNFMLQVGATYEKYGQRTQVNQFVGAREILGYLLGLSGEQVQEIRAFYDLILFSAQDVIMILDVVLLQKQQMQPVFPKGGKPE